MNTGSDPSTQIDEYLRGLDGWKATVARRIRDLVRSTDDRIVEAWKWSTPVWDMNGSVCALAVFNDHVKINFFKGAAIPDGDGIFNSGLDAKKTRAIDLTESDAIDEPAFKRLVSAAVALNEK